MLLAELQTHARLFHLSYIQVLQCMKMLCNCRVSEGHTGPARGGTSRAPCRELYAVGRLCCFGLQSCRACASITVSFPRLSLSVQSPQGQHLCLHSCPSFHAKYPVGDVLEHQDQCGGRLNLSGLHGRSFHASFRGKVENVSRNEPTPGAQFIDCACPNGLQTLAPDRSVHAPWLLAARCRLSAASRYHTHVSRIFLAC